jgi:hypothetical protein
MARSARADAPKPPAPAAMKAVDANTGSSAPGTGSEAKDINILLTANGRLQIAAEVDLDGLSQGNAHHYKDILKLLS